LPCYAADIELGWDPNTESNLAGYKIYYGTASGVPYDGKDIFEGYSPIKLHIDPDGDPNYYVDNDPIDKRCKFVLTGLDLVNYDYYIVLTAYNDEDPIDESGHSNEVNTFDVGGDPPPGGGGGSSGGCFIGSTEKIEKLLIKITAILFFMFVVAMAIIGLNFVVSVVSLFDSDVKVITLTSSIMLFLIIAILIYHTEVYL
jgi:hypothetical protein